MKKVTIFNCPGFSERERNYLNSKFGNVEELSVKKLREDSLKDTNIFIIGGLEQIITPQMIKNSNIEYIGVHAVGYNILPQNAFFNSIVTNVPNYCFKAVAELGIAYLEELGLFETKGKLFTTKRYLRENQQRLIDNKKGFGGIQGSEVDSYHLIKNELKGKKVGIIGLGKVGSYLADQLNNLGAEINYHSRTKKNCPYHKKSVEELFSESDVVYLTCALNEGTIDLVTSHKANLLRQESVLINLAREKIISSEAYQTIYERARNKELFFCDDVSFKPGNLTTVLTTPHIGFNTKEAAIRKQDEFISNLKGYLAGKDGKEINQVLR